MRRRGFLQRLVLGLGVSGFATLPYAMARLLTPRVPIDPLAHLRPPGALVNEEAFTAACIGCGACGEVCPPRCILFHRHEGGGDANTPYIDPQSRSCILCGLCMQVCPTDALAVTPIREVRMGVAQIDRAACYPWVDRGVCGACVSVCPLGPQAIDFAFGNFYRPVVQAGCVGCGQCVEVCPEPSLPIRIVDRALRTRDGAVPQGEMSS